jgi:hypothetical protein
MSKDRLKKRALLIAGCTVGVTILLLLIARPLSPAPSSRQPKITWNPSQVQMVLSQGQSRTTTVTFSSDQALQDVIVEAVPEIAPWVTIDFQTFPKVPAGTPETLNLTFTAAPGASIGHYDGTIHLRYGTQTYPQTLKISLGIVNPLGIDITDLFQRNQLVILGTVTSVNSAFDQSGASIFTTVGIQVSRILRGTMPSGVSSVNIQIRGGTVGQISSVIPGSPSFASGESVVVFLDGPDASGKYSIPDQALGTFHIMTDTTAGQIAVVDQAFSQMETTEGRTPDFQQLLTRSSQHDLSLTEFLAALSPSP